MTAEFKNLIIRHYAFHEEEFLSKGYPLDMVSSPYDWEIARKNSLMFLQRKCHCKALVFHGN